MHFIHKISIAPSSSTIEKLSFRHGGPSSTGFFSRVRGVNRFIQTANQNNCNNNMNKERIITVLVLLAAYLSTPRIRINNNSQNVRQFNKGIKMVTATFKIFDSVFEHTLGNWTEEVIISKQYSDDVNDKIRGYSSLVFTAVDCTMSASFLAEALYRVMDNGSPHEILKVLKKGKFIANKCIY